MIFAGSLQTNQTYEFQVNLIDILNVQRSFNAFLQVQIVNDIQMEIVVQ